MGLAEILFLAVALSMDAFAVAISKGLALGKRATIKHGIIVGLWFGISQGVMPLIGYAVASTFRRYIETVDHWIAFGLLLALGINMIREAVSGEEPQDDGIRPRAMLVLAIATSIDALAAGISLAMVDANIWFVAAVIVIITAFLSAIGVRMGMLVGSKFQTGALVGGGIILIVIGTKILAEHIHLFGM